MRALGTIPQSRLGAIHNAADVYIEAFPFGTTTALLEAALKGIPAVLAPAQCPPPYGSDGVALDDTLRRPSSLEDYKKQIISLSKNPLERELQGNKLCSSVTLHHTGRGWKQYLEDAIRRLPDEHSLDPMIAPVQTPQGVHEYWSNFVSKWGSRYEETLEHSVELALAMGLRPRLTDQVLRACKKFKCVRRHGTIPLPLLVLLCNFFLPNLPIGWAHNIFRFFSFMYRPSLLYRVGRRLSRLPGGPQARNSWYSEYRHARD